MEPTVDQDFTPQLQDLMRRANIRSFAALQRLTSIPRSQIRRLRQGQIEQLPMASVLGLCEQLQVPLALLWQQFDGTAVFCVELLTSAPDPQVAQLQQQMASLKTEYLRLQAQLNHQAQAAAQAHQRATLATLESLLLQWPTAAHAARQHPQAPALKLLPLLHPLELLLASWQIEPIGEVGAAVAYDPQWHQLTTPPGGTTPAVGDPVRVCYVGYRQLDQLLYRAKVAPLAA